MKNNEVLVEGNNIKIKENNQIKDLGNQGSSSVYALKYYKILDNNIISDKNVYLDFSYSIKGYENNLYYIIPTLSAYLNKITNSMVSFSFAPICYEGNWFMTVDEWLILVGFTKEQISLMIQEITEEEFYKID